jgi:NADP-dependent 3-hydroxy acid dehydrogenase YdfG
MSGQKIVVVSGGTKGIGRAIVNKFLSNDFKVFTCGSTEKSVRDLGNEFSQFILNGQLKVRQVNLAIKTEVFQWANEIISANSTIDILVNNAGVFLPGTISNEEDGNFEQLLNLNLASAYHLTRSLLPHLLKTEISQIFTICSTASITAYTNGGSYCISKFALLGMNKVLREELKKTNVRVTSVLPGATFTDSWASSDLPPDRFMKPEDVAECIWSAWILSPSCVVEEIIIRPQEGDI